MERAKSSGRLRLIPNASRRYHAPTSSLKDIDYRTLASLVDHVRGPGYVLDFSDRTFSQFFAAEFDVDIYSEQYAANGNSKGRRLRRFLELADNPTAAKVLKALWELRGDGLRDRDDPVPGAKRKYESLLERLGEIARDAKPPHHQTAADHHKTQALNQTLLDLNKLTPQRRGYEFEKFLNQFFDLYGLLPRPSFRNLGEQIDGSFILAGETYLLEAKWQNQLTDAKDLRDFEGKLQEKAAWARGLFVSYCGFSEAALENFGRGKRTICMDGLDIHQILDGNVSLGDAVFRKVRRAAETGRPFTPLSHLL